MTITNSDVIARDLRSFGAMVGAGKAAPIHVGKVLFANASLYSGKDGARTAYLAYAEGVNSGDDVNTQIDLGNKDSLKAGVSKFNVFLRLAATKSPERHLLIDRTIAIINSIDGKKPGVYETVLKVCRAQIEAKTADLSDDQIWDIVSPTKEPKTEVESAEAIYKAIVKHAKDFAPGETFDAVTAAFAAYTADLGTRNGVL